MTVRLLFLFATLFLVSFAQNQVGAFYEGWHVQAASAYHKIQQEGGQTLTVEDVVRSNGALQLDDMLNKYGMAGYAGNFYWQTHPEGGFYCIWRKRAGETNPPYPDCPNITATLTRHANRLTEAGVDFVVVDSTNYPSDNFIGDIWQLRPIEVLFEEWYQLRQWGIKTPKISVWATIPPGATLWQNYVKLFLNSSYSDLVFRDQNNRPVLYVVEWTPIDPNILNALASYGITVVRMGLLMPQSNFEAGVWGFYATCIDGSDPIDIHTTSVVGASCPQFSTSNSPLGREQTASTSYQVEYGSLPFQSTGKLSGLTLKKQFANIFQGRPNYVFVSSFNEHIAQPQANPFANRPDGFSMGLPNDPLRQYLFVDTYTAEFGRDWEPTVEYGDYYYNLMASCIRVYKSGATSCSNPGEECCNIAGSENYINIYAVEKNDGTDHLLTASVEEMNAVVATGQWQQLCTPYVGSSIFCTTGASNGWYGPFIAFSRQLPGYIPLYRCRTDGRHFFSPLPNCEGQITEGLLGFMSPVRSGNSLRSLIRCYNRDTMLHFHSLDVACPPGQSDVGILGYVR